MSGVDTHDASDEDDDESERPVRVIEGHAVQFNEYRY
jgi:hypothetical protein